MNNEGNHVVKDMPVGFDNVKEVMDQETYKWHHDTHYAGYVNKRNEVEKELAKADITKANANYSAYRSLKVEETWNANGEILHEIYWNTMGGNGVADPNLEVVKKLTEDFGSFENWKNDFIACGKSAKGWVVLSLDLLTDNKARNFLFDFHNLGGAAGSMPLVAADVFEHAYYHKVGPDRASYLNALVGNIDWNKVNKIYLKYKAIM